jgi:hypothetical protein
MRKGPDDLLRELRELFARIPSAEQMLVDELGPIIERCVARYPNDPRALAALAWLDGLRERIRKADPRTYAGRELPQSLTRLLQQ